MKLELVPIEGEKILSEEEKERLKRRTRPVPPEALQRLNLLEQAQCKDFLVNLIILTEQYHHDMEQHDQPEGHETHMLELNAKRVALFANPTPVLQGFIELLELYAMEAWQEFEILIKSLREEDLHRHRDTRLSTGIRAAEKNPFLMQTDRDVEEEHMELEMKTRITPAEIRALLLHYSLEEIVRHLIDARKVASGEFWNDGYYDL